MTAEAPHREPPKTTLLDRPCLRPTFFRNLLPGTELDDFQRVNSRQYGMGLSAKVQGTRVSFIDIPRRSWRFKEHPTVIATREVEEKGRFRRKRIRETFRVVIEEADVMVSDQYSATISGVTDGKHALLQINDDGTIQFTP